jgi:hypothetical protein
MTLRPDSLSEKLDKFRKMDSGGLKKLEPGSTTGFSQPVSAQRFASDQHCCNGLSQADVSIGCRSENPWLILCQSRRLGSGFGCRLSAGTAIESY